MPEPIRFWRSLEEMEEARERLHAELEDAKRRIERARDRRARDEGRDERGPPSRPRPRPNPKPKPRKPRGGAAAPVKPKPNPTPLSGGAEAPVE